MPRLFTLVLALLAVCSAQTPDYSKGYFVSVNYMGSTANADCVSLSKTSSPYFSAMLIGACLPQRGLSPGSTVVGGMMTTLSGSSATTTYYTDMTCTTPAAPYATLTFQGTTVSGSTTVTIDYNPGYLRAGLSISGTGIPTGATIVSMSSSTAFTLSASATASTAAGTSVTLSTSVEVNGNTCNGAGCPSTLGVCTAENGMSMRTFVSATVPDLGTYYASYYARYFYVSADECNAASTKVGYVSVSTGGLCVSRGSYYAQLSCPTTGAGGAVVTAKASSDSTCTGASINVPGQTTTSYTEPVCQQSTTYVDGQNISPPLFILPLLSACGSYGRPTPSPTPASMLPPGGTATFSSGAAAAAPALPSPAPTRAPTPNTPSAAGPRMQVVTVVGAFSYKTLHAGAGCLSTPDSYTVDPFQLNVCAQDTLLGASTYSRYTCKLGAVKNAVARQAFASTDAQCANAFTSSMLSHTKQCDVNPYGAGYLQYKCGPLPSSLQIRPQLLVKSYRVDGLSTAPVCVPGFVTTKAYILNACAPHSNPGSNRVTYHHKLQYISTSATTGAVTLSQTRFGVSDKNCRGTPVATSTIVYAASGCNRDPLDTSLATMQVKYHPGGAAAWGTADAFIRAN